MLKHELINQIIINSRYVTFPIKITSKKTGIKYLITNINGNNILYKEDFGKSYSVERHSQLANWNEIFLIQLNKLLKELQQGNIWED